MGTPFFTRGIEVVVPLPNFGGSVVGKAPFFVRRVLTVGRLVVMDFPDGFGPVLASMADTPPPTTKMPTSAVAVAKRAVRDEIFMMSDNLLRSESNGQIQMNHNLPVHNFYAGTARSTFGPLILTRTLETVVPSSNVAEI